MNAIRTTAPYCSLGCISKGYKSIVRPSNIKQSNRQKEIAKNPELEIVRVKDFLIRIIKASILFGISRRTIYNPISKGKLDVARLLLNWAQCAKIL